MSNRKSAYITLTAFTPTHLHRIYNIQSPLYRYREAEVVVLE